MVKHDEADNDFRIEAIKTDLDEIAHIASLLYGLAEQRSRSREVLGLWPIMPVSDTAPKRTI